MKTYGELKTYSTLQLIELAYSIENDDEYWSLIGEIHGRGGEVEFNFSKMLCESDDPIKRTIGADILGQLGWEKRTFQEESVNILINLLKDQNHDVIASAAFSLGHRNDARAIPILVKLINHQNLTCLEQQ